jgi:hypothetical protein
MEPLGMQLLALKTDSQSIARAADQFKTLSAIYY